MHQRKYGNLSFRQSETSNFNPLESFKRGVYKYVSLNELKSDIKSEIEHYVEKQSLIMQFSGDPHRYLKVFEYNFMKLLIENKTLFMEYQQKLFNILDDDDFRFILPLDKKSVYHLDWSTSKIKRILSEYLNQIPQKEFQTVQQIFERISVFSILMHLLFVSIFIYCQKSSNFQDFIEYETVKQVMVDYFEIQFVQWNKFVQFPQSKTIMYIQEQEETVYLINTHKKQPKQLLNIDTSQSINNSYHQQKNNQFQQLNFDEYNTDFTKNQFQSPQCQEMKNQQNKFFKSADYFSEINKQKPTRFHSQLNAQNNKTINTWTQRQNNIQISDKKQLSQNQTNTSNQSQTLSKISQLFKITSRRKSTQQSIFDDDQDNSQKDQYSFLDDSLSTLKNINDKKQCTTNINETERYFKLLNKEKTQQNPSLINKCYILTKIRKNKSNSIQRKFLPQQQNPFKKGYQNKRMIQQTNQKPDFRKVKTRRRKSQQNLKETQKSNQLSNSRMNKAQKHDKNSKKVKNQASDIKSIKQNPINPKQLIEQSPQVDKQNKYLMQEIKESGKETVKNFILQNPKKNKKNDNIYSKMGYVNMNISQQFTDSLILKQLGENYKFKIKAIKDKARNERDSIKSQIQQTDFVNNENLIYSKK